MAGTMNNGAIVCDRFGYKIHGKRYQRVSTIKGMLNTGSALIDWAARCVAEEARSIGEQLRDDRIDRTEAIVRLLDPRLENVHNETRVIAADFGTLFHKLVERLAAGDQNALDTVADEHVRDMWADAEAFLAWCDVHKPKWGANEVTVIHDKYQYAGTLDALVKVGNKRLLVDLKTSKAVYGEYALQMAAYRYAEQAIFPDGTTKPMPEVDGCAVLHVRDGRCELYEIDAGPKQFEAFLACWRLYWWKREQPKPVPFQAALEALA